MIEVWVKEANVGFGKEFPAVRAMLTIALARYYAERDFYHRRGRWGEGGGALGPARGQGEN